MNQPGQRMLAEMNEQPLRVKAALSAVAEQADELAGYLERCEYVVFIGRGSSRSAATYGVEALRSIAGKPAFQTSPAQLAWAGTGLALDRALIVALSQSGESTEILSAARRVVSEGGTLIVATNSPASELASMVSEDRRLDYCAGREVAVPATKSFTTSLSCLLGLALAQDRPRLAEAVSGIPEAMASVLGRADAPFDIRHAQRLVTAGEGYAEALAEEGAIKLRETLLRTVATFEASEFLHGSINSAGPETTVISLAADGLGMQLADQISREAATRGARTVTIGAGSTSGADVTVDVGECDSSWFPFLGVIPIQVAARSAALAAGLDPDSPVGLSKITRIDEAS